MRKKSLAQLTPAQRRAAFRLGERNQAMVKDAAALSEARGPSALRAPAAGVEAILPATLPPLPIADPLARPDALPTLAPLAAGAELQAATLRLSPAAFNLGLPTAFDQ